MYCSNCGAMLYNSSKFCGHCGAAVNSNIDNHAQSSSPKQNSQYYNNMSHTKNPFQLYLDTWKNLIDFDSITSRRGFWWPYLFHSISIFIIFILFGFGFFTLILQGIIYIPMIASSVRRMRDVNKPIFFGYAPLAFTWITDPLMVGDTVSYNCSFLIGCLSIISIIYSCKKSESNQTRTRMN